MRSLLLIPTAFEKSKIPKEILDNFGSMGIRVELCGFGLIASSAQTARLIALTKPERVVLVGIAGLYRGADPSDAKIGQAVLFDRVACYGVGVGGGSSFTSAHELGWRQLQSETEDYPLQEEIVLATSGVTGEAGMKQGRCKLLSATAASANDEEANEKLQRFPDATAEDMEGFGVAMACQLFRVPLVIARGLSNWVGDRDHSKWKVTEAMESACKLVLDFSRRHTL
ncbi:MAG: futalosine hydrolase [Pirellula sp.]|nr:futalosine hydrolase [Pirellula sp.]